MFSCTASALTEDRVNAATEAPFNFEREPETEAPEQEPVLRELHTNVTRRAWAAHGMLDSIRQSAVEALDVVTRFTVRMRALADRGPDPDSPADFHERLNAIERQLERARYAPQQHFSNGGAEESNWKTIALYVMGILQVVIIAFLSNMYSTQTQTHDDVVTIKCKLDPTCRVVVSDNARK